MISRLRFLRRFVYIHPSPTNTVLQFLTCRYLSTLFSSTMIEQGGQRVKSLVSLHFKRKRGEDGFCTRAMEGEEALLFSPYLSVRIRCSIDFADTLAEALSCFGADSTSIDEINSEKPSETWITSLFAKGQDVHACISLASDSIGLKYVPEYEVSKGERFDWLKSIEETFHPIEVTSGLWIVPKWKPPPVCSTYSILVQNATNIILNPGMAFGTGEHPTTMLCLCLLHSLIKGGEKLLDYGTGSGILGIAALKMGASFSVGIDVDPEAVASAIQNMALNEIEADKMRVYLVPEIGSSNNMELSAAKSDFDIVIANILLNPLLELAGDIVSYGKPGAVIALSGVLSEQIHQIRERFAAYMDNISVAEMDGWACVHGVKRRN
ncbi:uncharacterized protein LOC110030900 [Phalaenopsis equestris]|uniref:uncharacterized protein LOC110030900 n=1 Tax=Phalaenopsis equestris TaxID=78828 RepID=UPI0009E39614|nr:uncharacterized protein LOC110030900 [Phalaenopsis equestris]